MKLQCTGADDDCKGCGHSIPHDRLVGKYGSCSSTCHGGAHCVDIKEARKLKIEKLIDKDDSKSQ